MTNRAPAFRNHMFTFGPGMLAADHGVTPSLAEHKNLMPCVIFGQSGNVRVCGENQEISARIVRIRPDVMHTVYLAEGGSDILYLDGLPSDEGLSDFTELDSGLLGIPDAVKARDHVAIDLLRRDLAPNAPEPDIEVLKIIDMMYAAPMERLTQTQLSERLGLERTQALKHFKVNTGQTFRKFKMWAASVATVHGIMGGKTIGSAGIDSGFSDAAHVARTAKEIFGITPSQGTGALNGFLTI